MGNCPFPSCNIQASYVHRTGEGKQRIQCEYRLEQMIETELTAMIEHESVPRKLNTLLDSGLFQDGVSKISGNNIHGHGKSLTEEWVFPYFMTAFFLSGEYASIFEQNTSQSGINAAAHKLQRNPVFGCLILLKAYDHSVNTYINAIFCGNLRGDFPHAFGQIFVCLGFGSQSNFVAYGNPHAGFVVVTHFYNKE
ncbi:hypothetical protein BCL69_11394 [Nitrosomonas communis]|uniref:Uncharacterized protein n=1 Tax=Nitrosomonas communis TaxID=44574 RepID=A0A5D3Y6S6_9PROT|nr:hypothetical protein BCL69_11394 [Nitrosomonas communis]